MSKKITKMLKTARKYIKTTVLTAITIITAIVVWLNDLLPVLKGLLAKLS